MGLTTENAGAVVQKAAGAQNGGNMYIQITRQTHIGPTVVYVGQVIPVDERVGKELIAYKKAVEVDRTPAPPAQAEPETPRDAINLGESARASVGPDEPGADRKPARPKKK